MGNCLRKCFAGFDRRRQLLKTRYAVERDSSVEFENLMDEDAIQTEMTKLVTERERQLLTSKQYNTLVREQQLQDREVDRKLQEEEEAVRRQEEAVEEARREAARLAQLYRSKEQQARETSSPLWTTGTGHSAGEDDFDEFLESVRARSMMATAQLRNGGWDEAADTSGSSPTSGQTRPRSQTDNSNSIDLEWDHNEDLGNLPVRDVTSLSEESLVPTLTSESRESPSQHSGSADLEWDTEFTASDDQHTQLLLSGSNKLTTAAHA